VLPGEAVGGSEELLHSRSFGAKSGKDLFGELVLLHGALVFFVGFSKLSGLFDEPLNNLDLLTNQLVSFHPSPGDSELPVYHFHVSLEELVLFGLPLLPGVHGSHGTG